MKNINLSLTTLGKVINMLADDASGYIPYRESKLTRVLQDSLSGLGQTFLIATVSPTSPYTEASYNTVEFAKRTSKIKTVLHDELDFVEGVNVVQHLKEEIKYLKGMLQMKRTGDGISSYVYRIK
jgi:kinesin family protein 11